MKPTTRRRLLRWAALFLSSANLPAMSTTPVAAAVPSPTEGSGDDPFLWLEEVQGQAALDWVHTRNRLSQDELTARPDYADTRRQVLEVLNARDRIPAVTRRGKYLYNLWQDEQHKRGLWRRTTLDEYRQPEPAWDTLLDLDALATAENENWVWGGANAQGPHYRRFLISLSRGGADAKVVREFDVEARRFIDNGFGLPEAKSSIDWIDDNAVYVGTDFGPGSMTESGYPRIVKRWQRGSPLSTAVTVFEGQVQDVWTGVSVDDTPGFERILFIRALDFYRSEKFLLQGKDLLKLDMPDDASPSFLRQHLLLQLRSDWTVGGQTHLAGSLLACEADAYLAGKREFQALFTPSATQSLESFTATRDHLVLTLMDQVASRLTLWQQTPTGFVQQRINAPTPGTLSVAALHDHWVKDDPLANQYLLSYTDFLTPDSLLLGDVTTPDAPLQRLKARGALFDASGMRAEQHFARSADGTQVPYFIVWPRGVAPAAEGAAGSTPTLLYGYGGFEVSLNPWYSGGFGRAWLSRGGALVIANIRGGGEFGPAWHQAAVKEHKQRSYDDFIAVAEDLVRRRITSPQHLGIMGGSNGGLLVGATAVQRPDLFNAVVCQVPLLDMRRYHLLLAGASWMAEYGNPDDPAEWAFISRYSPYQNAKAGVRYPRWLFTTSTRDDRVHPGHARKMAARLLAMGHNPLYYENTEGGHGGAADNEQRAHLQALEFSYLWQQLK